MRGAAQSASSKLPDGEICVTCDGPKSSIACISATRITHQADATMAEAFKRLVAKYHEHPVASVLAASSILGLAWYVLEGFGRRTVKWFARRYRIC